MKYFVFFLYVFVIKNVSIKENNEIKIYNHSTYTDIN